MKLIDILVAELPKRGGWPESNMTKYNDILIRNKITYCTSPDYSFFEDWDGNQVTREQYEAALAATKERKMNWKYIKGSDKDFAGAPEWAVKVIRGNHAGVESFIGELGGVKLVACENKPEAWYGFNDGFLHSVIAQREPVAEWDGVGLPPVGCECEVSRITEWSKVRINYISADNVVFSVLYIDGSEEELCWATRECSFRHIRSEADKKRDEAIKEIFDILAAGANIKDDAKNLYDAGYRKAEQ